MSEITRVGADLAKSVIQIHAVDAAGKVVTNRPLPRNKFMAWCVQLPSGCLIAMEASSSAHHWARKLQALGLDARIIAAHLVAPYRLQGKGGKNDANDAAAICEAASRPQMHFEGLIGVLNSYFFSGKRWGLAKQHFRSLTIVMAAHSPNATHPKHSRAPVG